MANKYRLKIFELEAVQWRGDNTVDVLSFVGASNIKGKLTNWNGFILSNSTNAVSVPVGSWIVREPSQGFRILTSEYFNSTYELSSEPEVESKTSNLY